MNDQAAISVKNISKRYRLGKTQQRGVPFYKQLLNMAAAPFRNLSDLRSLSKFDDEADETILWALKDVSFEVQQGEVLGLIGKNGAGKSTLLKVLSRIVSPTSGEVHINGRVASLLEVGTGFHSDLTGRENVYLNGTILGMRKQEIDRKFDEIVAFSGVERFIDTPVKRYSSGMLVRLAFSVAANLEPEILIIDEVLAVGDVEFQKKCLGKMQDVASHGRTIIFVSHNMAAIRSLCSKGVLLQGGQVTYTGTTDEAISRYLSTNDANTNLDEVEKRVGGNEFRFTSIRLYDKSGNDSDVFISADYIKIVLDFKSKIKVDPRNMVLVITFWDGYGNLVARFDTREMKPVFNDIEGNGTFTLEIPSFIIRAGTYLINIWCSHGGVELYNVLDHIEGAKRITILAGDYWQNGAKNFDGSYAIIGAQYGYIKQ